MTVGKLTPGALLPSMAGALLLSFGMFAAPGHAAEEKTADEIARELTNPNNDLAKLTFKNQYRWYTGDLPDADNQGNYTLLFQPVFPFGLGETESGNKKVFFLRPAIPFLVDQPVFKSTSGFSGKSGLGDIVFDSALGLTYKSGWVLAGGMVGTLPTASASSEIGGRQTRLGPEALIANISKWGLVGVFPSHQWRVAGKDQPYSTTSIQAFAVHTAGGGWTFGTQPIMTYNWETERWTVPVEAYVSKTVVLGGRPWKFELQLDYYLTQEKAFGPQWLVSINVTPVVSNFFENMFKSK